MGLKCHWLIPLLAPQVATNHSVSASILTIAETADSSGIVAVNPALRPSKRNDRPNVIFDHFCLFCCDCITVLLFLQNCFCISGYMLSYNLLGSWIEIQSSSTVLYVHEYPWLDSPFSQLHLSQVITSVYGPANPPLCILLSRPFFIFPSECWLSSCVSIWLPGCIQLVGISLTSSRTKTLSLCIRKQCFGCQFW